MTDTKPEGPLIEKLAAIEHARWARWHKYCRNNWTSENVERWDRQADTEYRDLSEQEKEADRREVREYYGIVFDAGRASRDRLRDALNEIKGWAEGCYCLSEEEASRYGGKTCPGCVAYEALAEDEKNG